jgi:hypothetical protein
MRLIPLNAFAGLVAATTLAATVLSASAAQDTPMMSNGVEAVCTGVGSAKDNPQWNSYPMKVVFSNGAQEFVAGEHVTLKRGGQTLVETDCDAPWMLFKAPGGKYTVTASLPGRADSAHSADITIDGPDARQKRIDISFATPRKDQTSLAAPAGQ